MGRKNKRATLDVDDCRNEKLAQVPALVPDQEHLDNEHPRGNSTIPWYWDRYYERDRYYYYGEEIEAQESSSKELAELYSRRVAQHCNEGKVYKAEDWNKGIAYNAEDLDDLRGFYHINRDNFAFAIHSKMPRCEQLPARFGCWCSDSEEEERSTRPKSAGTKGAKGTRKYRWYDKRLEEINTRQCILEPWAYDNAVHFDNHDFSRHNPYLPSYHEWREHQREGERKQLKKELVDAMRADGATLTTKPSARTKAKAVEKPPTIQLSNRFSAFGKANF